MSSRPAGVGDSDLVLRPTASARSSSCGSCARDMFEMRPADLFSESSNLLTGIDSASASWELRSRLAQRTTKRTGAPFPGLLHHPENPEVDRGAGETCELERTQQRAEVRD